MREKLKPWRDVIAPHPDVASGRYAQAEFAADLAQVMNGTAEAAYQDPFEFFQRTYPTAGIRWLLKSTLERLAGRGGDPVIQLKTAFGGGKTHTMLAVLHLLSGDKRLLKIDAVQQVLKEADLKHIPKAKAAALVGTYLDPTKGHTRPDLKGREIRTLWGEMAWQLAGAKGYELVADADSHGSAPGGRTLDELFKVAGPCVILMDELVAYIRNIGHSRGLPGGTLDSNMTFIQSLTESVKRSPNAVLVASIPESSIEIGGAAGTEVLRRIENIFGRIEAAWRPVEAHEAFEVVRRRLFGALQNEEDRDATCSAFADVYRTNKGEFPVECRELDYERQMQASYPIHPEIFERLYGDWSTMERFHRTRGVLRLMAAVIHELWQSGDSGPLIMPGTLPLYAPRVREELLRYLNEQWNPVMDEVDGETSVTARIDNENQRFGQIHAARRLARTIFLGSVPYKATRGIEDVRIRLGAARPGDSLSTHNDALARLRQRLQFLYGTPDQGRYWFDVQPNLTHTVADRSSRVTDEHALDHLEERLTSARMSKADFAGIHVCPDDVPDEPVVRLVILSPRHTHKRGTSGGDALKQAESLLQSRESGPRRFRNMLVFAAADKDAVQPLTEEVRRYLAWVSIRKDAAALNLDDAQQRQVKEEIEGIEKTIRLQLDGAFQWVFAPKQEGTGPIEWEVVSLKGKDVTTTRELGQMVHRASDCLQAQELLILSWSPVHLRRELDQYLWKSDTPHISVKQLWDYFATYPYLSRLRDKDVLLATIKAGVLTRDFFGYAAGSTADGGYAGLAYGRPAPGVYYDSESVLIRPEIALAHLVKEETVPPQGPQEENTAKGREGDKDASRRTQEPLPKRFYGVAHIKDPKRIATEAGTIGQEVIQHLEALLGSDVEITLEITAKSKEGYPHKVVQTVTENARALKFEKCGFEEE